MPKILFAALHRPDRSPSQRFRYEQYITYLQNHNFECHFSYIINAEDDKFFYSAGNYLKKLTILLKSFAIRCEYVFKANQYDIIFVQCEAMILGTSFFECCWQYPINQFCYVFTKNCFSLVILKKIYQKHSTPVFNLRLIHTLRCTHLLVPKSSKNKV